MANSDGGTMTSKLVKIIRARFHSGEVVIAGDEIANGDYYVVPDRAFQRLVSAAYKQAHTVDGSVRVGLPDELIVNEKPYRIPEKWHDGDVTYYIERHLEAIPGKALILRWITPDVEMEEIVDKLKDYRQVEGDHER